MKTRLSAALLLVAMTAAQADNPSPAATLCEGLDAPALLPGSTLSAPDDATMCSYLSAPAVLVVNTASQCGYTPQFKELETLYQRYKGQGLMVLGFPSDNFGGQEYAAAEKTAEVCYRNYGVSFPVFEKSDVKGSTANPLFARLGSATQAPRWNFHKYLVTAEGVTDFRSAVAPLDDTLVRAIETALADRKKP